ncbi:ABC transporter permease [Streptomyces turgidiscabies]|uniref:Putative membrane protein n=1 Tax=Streptomyces turgidiscabies (strain Car8) TaxID=698760 RepID=L7FDD5_STRT8|nr:MULTISPECIES: ABC transporter permease [Streptomyces]ELP69297.1 putative membrane protein [Streptomyces turgidiscabies Car8]MDX3494668.1 ABC transporter permease [Streptomyces turgidiscabies]GAQ71276.1 ABC-2 family transporter protein [Streptomyces turgidiscabies]
MPFVPVLRSEWLKIRTLRSLCGALLAVFAVSTAFSALAGVSSTSDPEFDPLFMALSGVGPGQIAAIAFGATAVSSEFHGGGLRLSLAAVPRRGRWFAAKITAIAVPALLVGLLTGFASLAAARAGLGDAADGLTPGEQARGVVGCGIYLTLMALLAAGLTALLRSGVATLSILIPFILIISFVIGDVAGGLTDFLPDRAGQVILYETSDSTLGPWTGLAVTALWTATALLAGAWSVRRRDA